MPSLSRVIMKECTELLTSTVKMAMVVTLFTLTIILIGWFFSSSLPRQALLVINGR